MAQSPVRASGPYGPAVNPVRVGQALPQPLKALLVLWCVGCVEAVVAGLLGVSAVAVGPLGVVVVLAGLTLLTDLRGCETALAEATGTAGGRPEPRAGTGTVRLYGGLVVVSGVFMLLGALAAL